jgi:hypothetical protein
MRSAQKGHIRGDKKTASLAGGRFFVGDGLSAGFDSLSGLLHGFLGIKQVQKSD